MDYFKSQILDTPVLFRDLVEDDIETIVRYWHDSDPQFLSSLDADLTKIGSRDATRQRLLSSLTEGRPPTRKYFVVTSEKELLAYTNLNFRSDREAYAHFHVLLQSARTKAIMYMLFPDVFRTLFSRFALETIKMETLPENRSIDRFLCRFGLTPRRSFIDQPDGFGRPGELNVWELRKTE